MHQIDIESQRREEMVDITDRIVELLRERRLDHGWVVVYCPHTTAGLTINENADPDVQRDMLHALRELIPQDFGFHHAEGNADAHLKASLVGLSVMAPIEDGRLALGRWQGLYLCEFDGPRRRRLRVDWLESAG